MRLSEAIRRGAKLRPQTRVALFADGKSCAIGAAYEGATGKTCAADEYRKVREVFPELFQNTTTGGWELTAFAREIYGMNDSGQTREAIADWVEREYESKLPQKVRESDSDYTHRVLASIVASTPDSVVRHEEA